MGEGGLSVTVIVLIVVGSIIAAAGIGFLLFKLVFQKNNLKRQIRDLDRRFQYLHALLIGQDAQYVKRLEIISRTNLLYVDIHTKFLKRFKEIRDKHDAHAQSSINGLKDLVDENKYKQLKELIPDVREIISQYEKVVNDLNNDLLRVVKPEEDCRQSSLSLKEQLRRIKSDYYIKQGDLVILSESFDEVFKYIDELFGQFEEFVESAQYDDANTILPQIDKILHEIASAMPDLPNLCALVVSVIPDKLISLENAYENMVREDYPLHHLSVKTSVAVMRQDLEKLTTKIKRFDLKDVHSQLDDIASHIDEFFVLFDEEKKAREDFESQNEGVYRTVNLIEKRFIKLCNTIPEVSEIFIINEAHRSKINEIQTEINKVGALKRSLDTYIHSATKQPYSLLVEKMNELSSASHSIISEIDEYNNYFTSLKTDSENAFNMIKSLYLSARNAEKTLSDIDIAEITTKYEERINRFYELLNEVNLLLLKSPIDVDQVNACMDELKDINNTILDNGAISQDFNMMVLAENAILYANRNRVHLSDINQLVTQAETFFAKGDFEHAYIIAGNALQKVRLENERK